MLSLPVAIGARAKGDKHMNTWTKVASMLVLSMPLSLLGVTSEARAQDAAASADSVESPETEAGEAGSELVSVDRSYYRCRNRCENRFNECRRDGRRRDRYWDDNRDRDGYRCGARFNNCVDDCNDDYRRRRRY
jgi:hypothetical protein